MKAPIYFWSFLFLGLVGVIFPVNAQAKSASRTLTMHFRIEPIFDVKIQPRNGGQMIEFGTVRLITRESAETEKASVDISVLSNLGKPYEVVQKIQSPLANEKRETLPLENLLIQSDQASLGVKVISTPQPAILAEQVLFQSDAYGSSDHFTASYWLKVPSDQAGGDYQTDVLYTVIMR